MSRQSHVIISGTGRAGTSFLVRYLDACGLDTHLSRSPDAQLDPLAQAGLEDIPIPGNLENLPYVIKSPWLAFQPQVFLLDQIKVDAVIIPVRALKDAATSRVAIETEAMRRLAPWMKDLPEDFSHWGHVPGGMVFKLCVQDQERILATAFHHLVEYCVQNDIPLVFLDFPRFITDGDYLFHKLSSVLPLDRAQAMKAHRSIADERLVGASAAFMREPSRSEVPSDDLSADEKTVASSPLALDARLPSWFRRLYRQRRNGG